MAEPMPVADINNPDPALALAQLQDLLLDTDTLNEFLTQVAVAAADNLRRGLATTVSCGVTVRTHQRRATTLGTSDGFAAALDEVQYAHGEGPCLHALNTGEFVAMTDIAADQRWPRFSTVSAAQGAGSSMSFPMATPATGVIGALNIYSDRAHTFTDQHQATAQGYAQLAAGAVAIGVRLAQRSDMSQDLRVALASRAVIDQALGIVMSQRRCDADEAFEVLRHLSQTNNIKLRAIAAQVIYTVSGKTPKHQPPDLVRK